MLQIKPNGILTRLLTPVLFPRDQMGQGRESARLGLQTTLVVCSLFTLLLSGCLSDVSSTVGSSLETESVQYDGSYPMSVVATTGMVGDAVRAVGGKHVAVKQMLGPGVDPHLYKASRDDVRLVMRADIVFYCGLMLEGKMEGTLQKIGQRRPVFAVANGIPPEKLLGEGDSHFDPHVWMDLNLWVICVEEVAEKLSQFDPSHASDYRENAAAYRQQLLALDQYARAAIASIPENNRLFVTSHDAFQYFGRAYGLRVLGIQGISTESEAGLRHVNQLVDLLVDQRLPAVFFESSVPQRSIEALVAGVRSRGHNQSISGPLLYDAMGPEGNYTGTYLGMLDHNITLVAHKLGGQVPERGWQGQLGDASETEQAAQ